MWDELSWRQVCHVVIEVNWLILIWLIWNTNTKLHYRKKNQSQLWQQNPQHTYPKLSCCSSVEYCWYTSLILAMILSSSLTQGWLKTHRLCTCTRRRLRTAPLLPSPPMTRCPKVNTIWGQVVQRVIKMNTFTCRKRRYFFHLHW